MSPHQFLIALAVAAFSLIAGIMLGAEIFHFGPKRRKNSKDLPEAHREACEQLKAYQYLASLYSNAHFELTGISKQETSDEFFKKFEGSEFQAPRMTIESAQSSIDHYCNAGGKP
jgi:uncharacterized membrane-anchored protein YhcB (DUF1043 family)